MTFLEILKYPHPCLDQVCDPVTSFDQSLWTLLEDMAATMTASNGIGLAANQVGTSLRAFVMRHPDGSVLEMANPRIVSQSGIENLNYEGCLSFPGKYAHTRRARHVHVEWQDRYGEPMNGSFFQIHAVCVQHEIDHLDGKTIAGGLTR